MTETFLELRTSMSRKFRISLIKPISNKITRITMLIEPFTTSKLSIMNDSSKSVISDIYKYKVRVLLKHIVLK
ncbi:hypothetical protein A7978_05180 (plasmid) [Borrelia turicatae]|uniref:Uncharacterized protein n=1 Tax=Borrelia turicatae TaxID=142 RepID=A0A172XDC5_BORTU|nr:hypothetical protein [Borrelia turicatae]ANF34641.1 hypothetical protein A7978_05180 [Borrelia turicatae]UPA15855.1 hypothetical protein btBTE5EL_001588 [Borrelia turicatae]